MSEETTQPVEQPAEERELNINIKITNANLAYKSDFSEPETVFWLEAIKDIILKKAFQDVEDKS